MEEPVNKDQEKKMLSERNIFTVPFYLEEVKENITINTNIASKPSKEQTINQAFKFHAQGNISEAAKYYQNLISQGCNDQRVFSNYGVVLRDIGKLKEAEIFQTKAIQIQPDFAIAFYNLGLILKDLGKLKEAEIAILKAIELKPELGEAYNNLGLILKDLDKLEEAEKITRKAIKFKPDFGEAYNNLGIILKDLGSLKQAEIATRKAIELKPDLAVAHANLGSILRDLGHLREAEIESRKAIELQSDLAVAYSNLGSILIGLGKFKEAELSLLSSIKLQPYYTKAYYSLSILKYSENRKIWQTNLFSKIILNNKTKKDKIDIYFARANILHNDKKYKASSKYLQLANNLKLEIKPSKSNFFINRSHSLLVESNKLETNQNVSEKYPESIFIVGMPRSGTTLLESILSMNNHVYDLGEINIFGESFIEYKQSNQKIALSKLYFNKLNNYTTRYNITTNKWLYNYQYAGIISSQIPNAKIIHCYRNPLDNILSIYRTNFVSGSEYSSSLNDCANVYLDQEDIMKKYKNQFQSKIYDVNYEKLVSNSNYEIKSLITWLGWEWNDSYLLPHLNSRTVLTASSVQVRSPINSKSIGGWKNYIDMLRPAIEVLEKRYKYKNI